MRSDIDVRLPARSFAAETCPEHGLPLFPTIVGLRCPVCGAAAVASRRLVA